MTITPDSAESDVDFLHLRREEIRKEISDEVELSPVDVHELNAFSMEAAKRELYEYKHLMSMEFTVDDADDSYAKAAVKAASEMRYWATARPDIFGAKQVSKDAKPSTDDSVLATITQLKAVK